MSQTMKIKMKWKMKIGFLKKRMLETRVIQHIDIVELLWNIKLKYLNINVKFSIWSSCKWNERQFKL